MPPVSHCAETQEMILTWSEMSSIRRTTLASAGAASAASTSSLQRACASSAQRRKSEGCCSRGTLNRPVSPAAPSLPAAHPDSSRGRETTPLHSPVTAAWIGALRRHMHVLLPLTRWRRLNVELTTCSCGCRCLPPSSVRDAARFRTVCNARRLPVEQQWAVCGTHHACGV
jgi:hypothetical protein